MLNYSKKLDRKIFILGLLIFSVFLLATTMQTDFAATNSINNTTTGGISGALNSSSPGDIIELDEGIYTGNNNTNMTITKNITIQGKTKDKVILDAQGLSRIFTINNNFNVTFINITFINGNSINSSGTSHGGAIISTNVLSIMTIINCTVKNNVADMGGGFYFNGNVNITNSSFINNSANHGGGIFSSSGKYFYVSDSYFLNNTATTGENGGLFVGSYGTIYVINTTISNNTAFANGGIYIYSSGDTNTTCNIVDSLITNNYAHNYFAGLAISSNSANVTVNIINSIISNNVAVTDGGGISAYASLGITDVTIIDSIIYNNSAGNNGGGIFSSASINGTVNVNVYNSSINENTAGNNGGALSSNTGENSTGNSIIIVIDSDIENNTAGNNGDTASATTGDGSSGDSEIDIIGDSTIINNNPDKDDDGIYTSTGENSTGNSEINIDDGVIKKLSSNSTLIVSNTVVGKTVVIRGVAIDENGNSLANIQLTINIDGVDYNVTTNALGEWSLNYTPSSPGTITVTVDLNENNKYYAFTNTTNFNVAKANTRSTIIISNATSGKSTIIRGVLIDENGNTIANAPINLVIGGKSNNLVTGADGSWSLSYTPAKAGKFIAKVYYNGNTNNLASTSSLNYTVAQGTSAPKKTDIRLLKKKSSKVFRHGKRVVMKWFTYKNYGATGSKNITTKVIIKNLKYKLWKVYNKKISYKYGNNKIKFKLNLKSGEKFKLKIKVYKPIK